MFKRLLQAATITLLLNLLAYISPQATTPSAAISPSYIVSKIVLNVR